MYTDEQFEQLEQEEHSSAEDALAVSLLTLGLSHDEIEKVIRTFYQEYGKDGVVTYLNARKWVSDRDHRKRLTVLFSNIGDSFDTAFIKLRKEFRTHLREVVSMELDFFDLLDGEIDIDEILDLVWGADGLNWEQRLLAYQNKWASVICNDLKISLLKRNSIVDVLKDLDKRYVSMEKILWRLYVTETTAVGSLTRKQIFKELGIQKYRFFAREDERTCDHCGSLHGSIFPMTAYEVGVTASPIHAYCRCWEVPIID